MAESVTWMDPHALREWSKNPKQHDTANVQTLARSLRRFGFVAPVVVWGSEKQIVAGHGRCRAALLILKADPGAYLAIDAPGPGLIPVRVVEFASASEADMYAIQDNRSTEGNPMDPAAIAEILRELDAAGEEIEIPAYSDEEIASMLGGAAAAAEEPAADTSASFGGLQYRIIVSCQDEVHQATLLERFEGEGIACQPLIS